MKSQYILAVAFGALLVAPAAARAENVVATASSTSPVSAADTAFVTKAAQGGMFEVDTSKLAKKTTSNDAVKAFAQDMIDDHKKANAQLKKIAKSLNVTVPKDFDADKQSTIDSLKSAKGGDFDQKYIAAQDKAHNETLAVFQKEADKGDNAQLKAFATKTLPTLQTHMQKVKALEAKVPAGAASSTK